MLFHKYYFSQYRKQSNLTHNFFLTSSASRILLSYEKETGVCQSLSGLGCYIFQII